MKSISNVLYLVAENLRDAVRLNPMFPLRHVTSLVDREFTVSVGRNAQFHLRPRSSDASTIRQVFRDGEYDLSAFPQWPAIQDRYRTIIANGQVPLIIDAGANIGAASVWFANRFSEARVLAVEPDPGNAAQCRKNTSGLPQITVVEKAIGSVAGRVEIGNPEEESWAIQTRRTSTASSGIEVCTIAELTAAVPNSQIFIVKIDIEGFESDLFKSNTAWVQEATVIYIEPHDWMPSTRKSSHSFQSTLGKLDFEVLISGENLIYVSAPTN